MNRLRLTAFCFRTNSGTFARFVPGNGGFAKQWRSRRARGSVFGKSPYDRPGFSLRVVNIRGCRTAQPHLCRRQARKPVHDLPCYQYLTDESFYLPKHYASRRRTRIAVAINRSIEMREQNPSPPRGTAPDRSWVCGSMELAALITSKMFQPAQCVPYRRKI